MVGRALLGALAVALVVLLAAPSARAQDDDAERVAMARSLFQEGVELARREAYADAADRFRRAYAIRPAPAIAFNLASALAHHGALVEASEALQRVLRDPATPSELRAAAEVERADVARRLGRLTVRLEGDAHDVRVRIGARELPEEAIGVAIPFDPGAHEVVARRGDEDVARGQVVLEEGSAAELALVVPAARVEVPAAALVVAAPARTGEADRGGDDTWLWVGIVGGAAVAIGVAVTLAIVLTPAGEAAPSMGNAMPGVIEW